MRISFIASTRYALAGLRSFLGNERNGQRQLIIGIFAIIAGLAFGISRLEWIALIFCILLVIGMEMMNTAVEKTCNFITPEIRPQIKLIKDIAAGAVLFCSFGAAIIGIIIFLPYIVRLLNGLDG